MQGNEPGLVILQVPLCYLSGPCQLPLFQLGFLHLHKAFHLLNWERGFAHNTPALFIYFLTPQLLTVLGTYQLLGKLDPK